MDFESVGSRHIPEPDLVPILDALTSMIFFLLLSASFMSLTKLTVPPATVSNASASDAIPLNPTLSVKESKGNLFLKLSWKGAQPGELTQTTPRMMPRNLELYSKVQSMMSEFSQKFSNQKTMQVSLSNQMQYQELITVMDGVRLNYQDIVLVTPELANTLDGEFTK